MFERRIIAIPGPAIFDPSVFRELQVHNLGHLSEEFVEVFSRTLIDLRRLLFLNDDYKPIVLAGSGTLAMEASVSNLITKGDKVLVVSNGYFGERMLEILKRYPVETEVVRVSSPGDVVENDFIAGKVDRGNYSLVTVTHVDTSTGVRHPIEELAKAVRSKDTLLVVDGVCSVGGEEVRMKDWGIDVVFTASQKAVGVPPGLAVMWLSPKALDRLDATGSRYAPYYMDLTRWIEVMDSYERGKPVYFATPPINLIFGLSKSLELIFKEGLGNRFRRHRVLSEALRAGLRAMELSILAHHGAYASSTVTGVYLPDGIGLNEFKTEMLRRNVIVAGGIYPGIKNRYFRIGHMSQINANDIVSIIAAVERSLYSLGYELRLGDGIRASQEILVENNT
jgi:alanine-glyoxylate transaminase/serine-glyoxylate transaminase/serine-pyruvate transaminase